MLTLDEQLRLSNLALLAAAVVMFEPITKEYRFTTEEQAEYFFNLMKAHIQGFLEKVSIVAPVETGSTVKSVAVTPDE